MRVGPSVVPGSTWGESGALSGAWECLGAPGVRMGPSVGPGSNWGESGALSGARGTRGEGGALSGARGHLG